jgi:hypothetical protein
MLLSPPTYHGGRGFSEVDFRIQIFEFKAIAGTALSHRTIIAAVEECVMMTTKRMKMTKKMPNLELLLLFWQ